MGVFWGGSDQRSCPSTRRPEPPRQITAQQKRGCSPVPCPDANHSLSLGLATYARSHAQPGIFPALCHFGCFLHRLEKRPSGCPAGTLEMCAAEKTTP